MPVLCFLAYFTEHSALRVHPCCSRYQSFLPFYGHVRSHCRDRIPCADLMRDTWAVSILGCCRWCCRERWHTRTCWESLHVFCSGCTVGAHHASVYILTDTYFQLLKKPLAILLGVRWCLLLGLICISLMTNETEHLLSPRVICRSFVGEMEESFALSPCWVLLLSCSSLAWMWTIRSMVCGHFLPLRGFSLLTWWCPLVHKTYKFSYGPINVFLLSMFLVSQARNHYQSQRRFPVFLLRVVWFQLLNLDLWPIGS